MAHSVSRSDLFAGLLAAALMAVAAPAVAKKKKAAPAGEGEPGLSTSGKAAEGSAQAQDQERPKPILEEAPGPEADAKGNVNFMGAKTGKGRITVNAPAKEKAKIYLEGRYFGVAPRTINKIPPGDYILEINYPNGKSVTKPVSVSGDEESVVELGGAADFAAAAPTVKPMAPEKIEKRLGT
ncbi:MAG: PEGA domain-containing protein, partial [Deltaproteobacteria bacterium]|nr:PEGA domain-containing protein [Deltaproteobacteria bacterium]